MAGVKKKKAKKLDAKVAKPKTRKGKNALPRVSRIDKKKGSARRAARIAGMNGE